MREAAERWSLTLGDPYEPGGVTAWVAPAVTVSGEKVVLKVGIDHPEGRDEGRGLQAWEGAGAVRALAVTRLEGSTALLLEQCEPGTPLSVLPEPEQDLVVASVLQRLWSVPAGPGFRPLSEMCEQWAAEADPDAAGLDRGLAVAGIDLWLQLSREDDNSVLLATDLHAGNVLSAQREPWLMIDPKPYVGDPTYDLLQHLLNCQERLLADPLALIARMAGLAGLDPYRLRSWLFARLVVEARWFASLVPLIPVLAPH